MSNAGSLLRLGCSIASIAGIAACAQGVQDPGMENLTGDDGGSGVVVAGSGNIGMAGAVNRAGSPAQGGAPSGAGRGGGNNGGKSGATGSAGKGGTTGGAGAAGSGTAGAGTGPQGCSHPQPGEDNGMTVQYKTEGDGASASVPYVFFSAKIDSPDADSIPLSDLKLRYYFVNDLTSPAIDIYSPQVTHTNMVTENVSAGDVKTTFAPTYLEVSFTSTYLLLKGEHLTFQAHFSSVPVVSHNQSNDYSWSASSAFAPNCKIALFRGASSALAWGTPEP